MLCPYTVGIKEERENQFHFWHDFGFKLSRSNLQLHNRRQWNFNWRNSIEKRRANNDLHQRTSASNPLWFRSNSRFETIASRNTTVIKGPKFLCVLRFTCVVVTSVLLTVVCFFTSTDFISQLTNFFTELLFCSLRSLRDYSTLGMLHAFRPIKVAYEASAWYTCVTEFTDEDVKNYALTCEYDSKSNREYVSLINKSGIRRKQRIIQTTYSGEKLIDENKLRNCEETFLLMTILCFLQLLASLFKVEVQILSSRFTFHFLSKLHNIISSSWFIKNFSISNVFFSFRD